MICKSDIICFGVLVRGHAAPGKLLKIDTLKWHLEAILHAKSLLFVNINGNLLTSMVIS